MVKARMTLQLKEAFIGRKSPNRNLNLVESSNRFQQFRIKLKRLVEALQAQHASMVQINKTRFDVALRIADLAKRSPVSEFAGTKFTNEEEQQDHRASVSGDDTSSTSSPLFRQPRFDHDGATTYLSIHQMLSSRQKMYADRFREYVVQYAIEWEQIVVGRVSTSLEKAETLRLNLDHYQEKVESLRNETNRVLIKGKSLDPKAAERLQRNEVKWTEARKEYEVYTQDLCVLIDEVTERGWRDLHPILIKMAQFDATLASDESDIMSNLLGVADGLKKLAHRYGLKPETRLRDLEGLTPTKLSTKEVEDTLIAQLLITDQPLRSSGSTSPPSTFAASTSSSSISFKKSPPQKSPSSNSSGNSPAMAVKSAPPPTLEDVEDSQNLISTRYSTEDEDGENEDDDPPTPKRGGGGRNPFHDDEDNGHSSIPPLTDESRKSSNRNGTGSNHGRNPFDDDID